MFSTPYALKRDSFNCLEQVHIVVKFQKSTQSHVVGFFKVRGITLCCFPDLNYIPQHKSH